MNTIKAIIIEDEVRSQIFLKGILEEVGKNVNVLDICDDLPSGVIAIRKHKPDLVFLDIEMPKYNGLEIVNFFNEDELNFSIIFTTAYSQYAIQAFKTSALDYLLKPIDPEEVLEAINRFEKKKEINNKAIYQLKNTLLAPKKISFPDGQQTIVVDPNEIIYLKAENSYTQIVLTNKKKYITSRFLKNFEEVLSDNKVFLRCHKSYIINIDYMIGFNKSNGGTVLLKDQIEIPVSNDKIEDLLSNFNRVNR